MATEIASATVRLIPSFQPDIPRIQILELPMEHAGEYSATPFAVVFDGVTEEQEEAFAAVAASLKETLGARGVLIFRDRVAV